MDKPNKPMDKMMKPNKEHQIHNAQIEKKIKLFQSVWDWKNCRSNCSLISMVS